MASCSLLVPKNQINQSSSKRLKILVSWIDHPGLRHTAKQVIVVGKSNEETARLTENGNRHGLLIPLCSALHSQTLVTSAVTWLDPPHVQSTAPLISLHVYPAHAYTVSAHAQSKYNKVRRKRYLINKNLIRYRKWIARNNNDIKFLTGNRNTVMSVSDILN